MPLILWTGLSVGPSSSHTVGPMRAGKIFIKDLEDLNLLEKVFHCHETLSMHIS
jgi:hypothetical protein